MHVRSHSNFYCLPVLPDTDIMIEPSYAPLQVTFVTETWDDKATVHESENVEKEGGEE
jgi:hypothetical protein